MRAIVAAEKAAVAKSHNRGAAIRAGRDAFYKGDIARRIADANKAAGGVFTYQDLASFHGSQLFDANGLALLERAPEVAGVYPVRPMYPATTGAPTQPAPTFGRPPALGLSSVDGRGVTVALLDTGVDRAQPFLRGGGFELIRVVPTDGLSAILESRPISVNEREG